MSEKNLNPGMNIYKEIFKYMKKNVNIFYNINYKK